MATFTLRSIQSGAQRIHCVCQVLAMKNARVLIPLLASVGGRRLYFKSRHTLWQIEHGDFSSIPPIEELPDTIVPSISIIYYSAGWSVGSRVWTSSMLTGSRRTQPMRSIGN